MEVWLNKIAQYEREFKKWEGRVEKILKRYKDENRPANSPTARFNILWSNVQTLVPATYARMPQPDVSRRFRDQDPVGRVAALILERALDFEIQHYPDFRGTMKACVYDRFLGGRGTSWARYEPKIGVELEVTEDQERDGEEVTEKLEYECAPVDYVHWKDFGHDVARTWEEVTCVWRKVYMTRAQLVERFGEEGKKIPLDSKPDSQKKEMSETPDSRGLIYEIWTKEGNKAIWLSKSLGTIVDELDDPLGLEGFFPCPKPLYATLTNDSLLPVPDFTLYQDQANELDIIADRIDGLVKAMKVTGVYNAEFPEIHRLFMEAENNSLIPVKNFLAFAEKQGLKGAIDIVDLTPIASALRELYGAMEQIKSQIYDITGLADIVRGQSQASETATAQQIKGQYASLRLRAMQGEVARFASELLQLKAQIMVSKFDPQTLLQMAAADQLSKQDQEIIPQAMQLLLGERAVNPEASSENPVRAFRIEVATDSMVQLDEQEEKQARTELITAVGNYLQKAEQTIQTAPLLAPLAMEMLKFSVTSFKVGKTLEGLIDETAEKIKMATEQKMQQPPPPSPEMMKIQADQQANQQKLQADQQAKAAELQQSQQQMQMEAQFEAQRIQLEEAARMRELQMQAQIEAQRNEMEAQRAAMQAQIDAALKRFEIQANNEAKIEVAEISSQATLQAAQTNAAKSASEGA
jgi:hypothetical protein